jgi:ribose transport system permease protein
MTSVENPPESATAETPADSVEAGRRTRGPSRLDLQRVGLLLALVLVVVVFSVLRPQSYPTVQNAASILSGSAALTLVSLAIMLPLIVQQYDLSVAYTATIAGLLTIGVMSRSDWSPVAAIVLGLAVSVLIGLINGLLVGYGRLNSLVVTLGIGSAVYGASMMYSEGELIFANVPQSFKHLGQGRPLGIPLAFLYALVVGVVVWYFLSYRRTGRRLYAIGGSETAARLAGVRVPLLVLLTFVLSGLLAGLGGIVQAARVGSGSADAMTSFLLPAFTAAFLGATAIRPGHFNVWGTFIAVYLIAAGSTGMFMLGAPTYVEPLFNGVVLLVAISAARLTMAGAEDGSASIMIRRLRGRLRRAGAERPGPSATEEE